MPIMSADGSHVLLSVEAEGFVQALEKYHIKDVGSARWTKQHEYVEKLNMQAVISASMQEEEFVKEFLITYEKVPVLIHDLIVTEVWKERVFSELISMNFEPKTTFQLYMVLYHEATVANLLETIMYHKEVCEVAEENIIDLIDYCYRKLSALIARHCDEEMKKNQNDENQSERLSNMEELKRQEEKLQFDICIKAVSILRYVTDHLDILPLSVTTRLLNSLDIPVLLVQLVDNPPWTRREAGKISKYIDSKWQDVSPGDFFKLTKTEGQVWIALFHLLMEPNCQQKYELSSYRKNVLIKLRPHMCEVLLDQMPMLGEVQRYLEHLSMMDPPATKKDLVLEQIPEIREAILKENSGKWSKIAKYQSKKQFNLTPQDMKDQAKRWADTYNFDVLEGLISEPPKCAVCGEAATKRCSRCQNEWYCRRECQVAHWSKHKKACDLLFNSLEKLKEQEKLSGNSVKS